MKINKCDRKDIWDKYCELETLIRDIKGIVQNDIELTESDIHMHSMMTSDAIMTLTELEILVTNKCL